jgi:hypothetical protein
MLIAVHLALAVYLVYLSAVAACCWQCGFDGSAMTSSLLQPFRQTMPYWHVFEPAGVDRKVPPVVSMAGEVLMCICMA